VGAWEGGALRGWRGGSIKWEDGSIGRGGSFGRVRALGGVGALGGWEHWRIEVFY